MNQIFVAYKILIAEDNAYACKQYKMVLEKLGHKVTITTNGLDCVQIYEHAAHCLNLLGKSHFEIPFQIVLLDHDMPHMTGAEAAKKILKINPNQRIVFLSAYGKKILQDFKKEKTAIPQIIQKPFTLKFLEKFIEGRTISSAVQGMYG